MSQGERGPPGNNGEKGERGDYVSNFKIILNSKWIHCFPIFITLIHFAVCVFQGQPGIDGERGERVNDFSDLLPVSERQRLACVLISVTVLRREPTERRASKAPVETEAREEQR